MHHELAQDYTTTTTCRPQHSHKQGDQWVSSGRLEGNQSELEEQGYCLQASSLLVLHAVADKQILSVLGETHFNWYEADDQVQSKYKENSWHQSGY
jgi:hypothetical protein